jgi:hypothetical protein
LRATGAGQRVWTAQWLAILRITAKVQGAETCAGDGAQTWCHRQLVALQITPNATLPGSGFVQIIGVFPSAETTQNV